MRRLETEETGLRRQNLRRLGIEVEGKIRDAYTWVLVKAGHLTGFYDYRVSSSPKIPHMPAERKRQTKEGAPLLSVL